MSLKANALRAFPLASHHRATSWTLGNILEPWQGVGWPEFLVMSKTKRHTVWLVFYNNIP